MKLSLFPKEKQKVKIKLPKDTLIRELSENIDIGGPSMVWILKGPKKFSGHINDNRFNLQLKTNYRNSFKPRIIMEVHEVNNESELSIEYKLDVGIKVVSLLWISFNSALQAFFIYNYYEEIIWDYKIVYLSPLAFIVFLLVLTRMSFYVSADHAKSIISKRIVSLKWKYGLLQKRDPRLKNQKR